MEIPPRLFQSEVLEMTGLSHAGLRGMQKRGEAPEPLYRSGYGNVYATKDIYRFLKLIDDDEQTRSENPFDQGLEKLGNA